MIRGIVEVDETYVGGQNEAAQDSRQGCGRGTRLPSQAQEQTGEEAPAPTAQGSKGLMYIIPNEMKQHIEQCPEHPMSALKAERDRLAALNRELVNKVIQAAYQPRPICRDCADRDGTCYNGEKCDPFEAALDRLRNSQEDKLLIHDLVEALQAFVDRYPGNIGVRQARAVLAKARQS